MKAWTWDAASQMAMPKIKVPALAHCGMIAFLAKSWAPPLTTYHAILITAKTDAKQLAAFCTASRPGQLMRFVFRHILLNAIRATVFAEPFLGRGDLPR